VPIPPYLNLKLCSQIAAVSGESRVLAIAESFLVAESGIGLYSGASVDAPITATIFSVFLLPPREPPMLVCLITNRMFYQTADAESGLSGAPTDLTGV
jgi:hypothetical protein